MASTDLPKKYKAAVYDKPGSISTKIEELDMPVPGPGEVLINLYVPHSHIIPTHLSNSNARTHSGVCHSDMGVMMNSWSILPAPTQAGQVGGHEGVGKIVQMGPGTDNAAVKVGDRVGIKWMAGICESCEACRAGQDANCFSGVRTSLFPFSQPNPTSLSLRRAMYTFDLLTIR
jgi:propanol-preferring alcohol dehydrogenase